MKQQKRWEEQMRAMGDRKSPEPGMNIVSANRGGNMGAVAITGDMKGAPAMVMLAQEPSYELPLSFLKEKNTRGSMDTSSPSELGSFFSGEKDELKRMMEPNTTATTTTTTKATLNNTQASRSDKTATWLKKNSIYEMP